MKQSTFMSGVAVTAFIVVPACIMGIQYVIAAQPAPVPVQEAIQPACGDLIIFRLIDLVARYRPADEYALMSNPSDREAYDAVDGASNDIVKHRIWDQYDKAYCSKLAHLKTFKNWTGTLKHIRWNGSFDIDLEGDLSMDGSADPGTPLFEKLAAMKEGDPVTITGQIDHVMTENCGVFADREFIAHVTDIKVISKG